jgi:syntaxin 5
MSTKCDAHTDSLLFNQQRQDPMGDGGRSGSKGKARAAQNGDILALNLGSAEEGSASQNGSGAFMQMQLLEQQVCKRVNNPSSDFC